MEEFIEDPSFYNEYLCEDDFPKNVLYKLIENNVCLDSCPLFDFFKEKCIINPNNNIKDIIKITSNLKNELKTGLMNEILFE